MLDRYEIWALEKFAGIDTSSNRVFQVASVNSKEAADALLKLYAPFIIRSNLNELRRFIVIVIEKPFTINDTWNLMYNE